MSSKKKDGKDHVAAVQLYLFASSLMLCSLLLRKCEEVQTAPQKAVECSAVPLEMLETALQNLNSQKKQLLSDEEKENFAGNCDLLKY